MRSRALVVLGMHRSGTSALTRTLALLGAELPRNLLPPRANDNETGFWESSDLLALHDEILETVASGYDEVGPLPREWFGTPAAARFRRRIEGILHRDFEGARLIALKDPRMCRLVPLWREVFEHLSIAPFYVLSIRHPLEVAASLQTRNGFMTAKSCLLWLRHVLESEVETRDQPRTLVHYEDLLRDWRRVADYLSQEAGFEWPRALESVAQEIDRFLSAKLRHHSRERADLDASALSPWLRDCYTALCEAPPGTAALDRIRHEIEKADIAFAPLVGENRRRHLENELAENRRRAEESGHALAALGSELGHLEQSLLDARGRLLEREERIGQLAHELLAASERISRLERERDELERDRSGMLQSRSWKLTAPLRDTRRLFSRASSNGSSVPTAEGPLGQAPDREFIEALYWGLLGRAPDREGLAWHLERLASGAPRRDLARGMLESAEIEDRLRDDLDGQNPEEAPVSDWLEAVYQLLFARKPDPAGVVDHHGLLGTGRPRVEVLERLVWSREFADLHLDAWRDLAVETAAMADEETLFFTGSAVGAHDSPVEIVSADGGSRTVPHWVHWSELPSTEEDRRHRALVRRQRFIGALTLPPNPDLSGSRLELIRPSGPAVGTKLPDVVRAPREVLETLLRGISPEALADPDLVNRVGGLVERLVERCRSVAVIDHEVRCGATPVRPELSIVLAAASLEDLEHQLVALAEDPNARNAQILVVSANDAAEEDLRERLHSAWHLYRVPTQGLFIREAAGMAFARNAAARMAEAPWILFLGDEVFPDRSGWIGALLDAARSCSPSGVTGARLLHEDDSIAHVGLTFSAAPSAEELWRVRRPFAGMAASAAGFELPQLVPAVGGDCLIVERALFEHIEGFHGGYVDQDSEAADLCLRAAALGHPSWIADATLRLLPRASRRRGGNGGLYDTWLRARLRRTELEALANSGLGRWPSAGFHTPARS